MIILKRVLLSLFILVSFHSLGAASKRGDSSTSLIQPPPKRTFIQKATDFIASDRFKPYLSAIAGDTCTITTKFHIAFEGLAMGLINDITYPEGLWMGQKASFIYQPIPDIVCTLTPACYYTTKRKKVYWYVHSKLLYAPQRRGELFLQGGMFNDDLDNETLYRDEEEHLAMLYLSPGISSSMRFERTFVKLSHSIDLVDGLSLQLFGQWRRSTPVTGNKLWMLWNHVNPEQNWSAQDSLNSYTSRRFPIHETAEFGSSIEWNPKPEYRTDRWGRRVDVARGKTAPLFTLSYRQAIPINKERDSQFSFLGLTLRQRVALSPHWALRYRFEAGHYFDKTRIYPEERIYFKGNNSSTFISRRSPYAFFTPIAYTPVDRTFARLNTLWDTDRFLNKFIHSQRVPLEETLHFSAYWGVEQARKPFFEMGYSLTLWRVLRLGLFYGGYNFYQQRGYALRVCLRMAELKHLL